MRIEHVNGVGIGLLPGTDAEAKNIQRQIENKQKELQKLSENKDMSMEDKLKKRQEIQQEISELNMQLQQHQMERRMEQQQRQNASSSNMSAGQRQVSSKSDSVQNTGLSQAAMTAVISADSSLKQAQVQGSVATRMKGRARVLKAEIKQDEALGGNTQRKREELAATEQKASEAVSAQMNTLSDANKTMEEAAKADREDDELKSSREKSRKDPDAVKENGVKDTDAKDKEAAIEEKPEEKGEADGKKEDASAPLTESYPHVDVRL